MSDMVPLFTVILISMAVGYAASWFMWRDRVRAAEAEAEESLSRLNYWHEAAKAQMAETNTLARELGEAHRMFRTAGVVVGKDPGERTVGDDDDEQPMSIREADRLEMKRRREAEDARARFVNKVAMDDFAGLEPVHVDDRRAEPPKRLTDLE